MGQIQKLVDRYYAWNWGNQPQLVKETKERVLTVEETEEVKKSIKLIYERLDKYNENQSKKRAEENLVKNSVCPHCQSKNVNDRIKSTEGDVEARAMTTNFGYSSSSSLNTKVSIKTFAVNKCNYCKHEWKKEEGYGFRYDTEFLFDRLRQWLESWVELETLTYNPTDINEQQSSLEEKRTIHQFRLENSNWLPLMKLALEGIDYSLLYHIVQGTVAMRDFYETRWRDISNDSTSIAAEKARLILKMK